MKQNLPTRKLREHPDLDQLKRQAKELLKAFLAGEAEAVAEVKAHYRDADPVELRSARRAACACAQLWLRQLAQAQGICRRRHRPAPGGVCLRGRSGRRYERCSKGVRNWPTWRCRTAMNIAPLHYAVMNRAPRNGAPADASMARTREKASIPHRDATTALTIASERGYDEIVAIIHEEEQRRREAMSASDARSTSSQDELSERHRTRRRRASDRDARGRSVAGPLLRPRRLDAAACGSRGAQHPNWLPGCLNMARTSEPKR